MEEMGQSFVAIWMISALFSAFVCACLARDKGMGSGVGGFFVGLLIGVLGVLYYVGAPDLKLQRIMRELLELQKGRTVTP
jgi:hypothetical protein